MFDFHEKRKIRKVLYSWFSIAGMFLVGGFVAFSAYGRYEVERDMAEKLVAREAELASLQHRASSLEASVLHLSDDRGIEEELRNRFDVAKEGEQVVIILDDPKTMGEELQNRDNRAATTSAEDGFFKSFIDWMSE
jgi:cell division protein FtsB